MSIDKSLKRKNTLARSRNVLTRGERIIALKTGEKWKEGQSPFGLPKVRVLKAAKKAKKAAKEAGAEATPAAGAPAAAAATEKKPAEKKDKK